MADRGTAGQPSSAATGGPGRPLRVLHIGNIANNAYKNAKLLNEAGLDCDVLCFDYYHIMGSPEWEDADFEGSVPDQFFPDWSAVNLRGFRRPRWFAQGSLLVCIRYLLARRRGQARRAAFWWRVLALERWWRSNARARKFAAKFPRGVTLVYRCFRKSRFLAGAAADWLSRRRPLRRGDGPAEANGGPAAGFPERAAELVAEFRQRFPDRADPLTMADLREFEPTYPACRRLFEQYDLIQAYATYPIMPVLCAPRPVVAFEHGTLRDLPYEPTWSGRMTAIGYALADGVFITNGDCQAAIPRLGLRRAVPMIHPLDEREYGTRGDPTAKSELHERLRCEHVFACTLRHDWAVKGTDLYLRALPALVDRLGRSFRLVLTNWGSQIEESRALLKALKVDDLVEWIEPLPRRGLIRLLQQADVLFDQTALPHFGATAPEGIAAGVPVLMSYRPESTRWIIPEPAPILPVFMVADVVAQTVIALDPEWRKDYQARARRWIERYHSARRLVEMHRDMYELCLAPGEEPGARPGRRLAG